jgi:enterochelin esterase-like enzyme
MKYKRPSFFSRFQNKRLLPVLWFLVSLILAFLGGIFLFANSMEGFTTVIINVGLDPQRAQFIAALLLTLGAACIGALLGRRKAGAFVGAGLIFGFSYLYGFVQTQVKPVLDPGGHPEALNSGALIHNTIIMLALGLLSAFVGSAIGAALAEAVLDPLYQLIRSLWQRFVLKQDGTITLLAENEYAPLPGTRTPLSQIGRWLTAGIVIAIVVLAANSSDLFVFSPDVGVHTKPQFKDNNGQVLASTVVPDSLVSSALQGQRRTFLVYLPPSYNTPAGKNRHYPTLYLLHGTPGKVIDWITGGKANESADELIATHRIPELIMIMPDGNGRPGQTPEWGNSADQKQMMENFVALDLVRYVDQHYRTIANPPHRGIGGLSEGGFGAMNIAVHHPDVFGTAISIGGYYRAEGSIWGRNTAYQQANSPIYTIQSVQQAWKLHIFLGSATKDQPYYKDTQEFMQELDKLHIPYHFDLEAGYHSWRVWQEQMYKALAWIKWG